MTWSAKLARWLSVADTAGLWISMSPPSAPSSRSASRATSGFSRSRGWGSARRTSGSRSTQAATAPVRMKMAQCSSSGKSVDSGIRANSA